MKWIRRLVRPLGGRPQTDDGNAEPDAFPAYPLTDHDGTLAVIGDIHGRSDLLARVHAEIDAFAEDVGIAVKEIYLGDYVDRGPDSSGVIERILGRRAAGRQVVCLRGNHEAMMLGFLQDPAQLSTWLEYGGRTTLASYGVPVAAARADPALTRDQLLARMPKAHAWFLAGLVPCHKEAGYFFAHAGVRPGIPLADQDPHDLLWIREPFRSSPVDHGAIVVHGHTPERRPSFRPNRIGLDTGAFHTGVLTCLLITAVGVALIDTTP